MALPGRHSAGVRFRRGRGFVVTAPGELLGKELAEFGFEPTPRLGAVAWRGKHQGRSCVISLRAQTRTAYYGEARKTKRIGWVFHVELETKVRTKLFFVKAGFAQNFLIRRLYRWRKLETLAHVPAGLEDSRVVTIAPTWAEQFVAEPDVVAATVHLMREEAKGGRAASVHFAPTSGMSLFHFGSALLQGDQVTIERVRDVLMHMQRIVEVAERLPPPPTMPPISAFGRFSEKHPIAIAFAFFGCALLVLGIPAVVVLAIAMLLSRG